MTKSYNQHLYCHIVWSIWDRLPLITSELEPSIYRCIKAKCKSVGVDLLAIGGTSDHIHILVRFQASIALSKVVNDIKGSSSHFVSSALQPDKIFKWQTGYGAFTVSKESIDKVSTYIHSQKQHHKVDSVQSEWELP